ncbi:GTP--adenosylcobinamide-phosphate guanylyltransferase [Pacificimonas flava]|uniref:GTP--adenosylcobinamide-phosphate guanylyltransferase n=2 Tax=Pacificimonas TaxID=1960290 RepID=A0A219B754_9SPHN|nr:MULTISPECIES: NTP transferase domain-containing protein [Pacificimonas]MBZ6378514.1 nucleotidyltransferase family protein [Pacificimonas aurantium]OWV34195.1 GTP--adenosylcobinamide-phosphate guanylyltransferase [Pacificimonas flava]
MTRWNALILAGSRDEIDPVARAAGAAHKALVEVGGEPMLARVIDAVKAAGAGRVAISSNDEDTGRLAALRGAEVLPAAEGPSESARSGFAALGSPMLLTTADHALLRPAWIESFIKDVPDDCDAAILLARRADIEAAVPGNKRTYLRFADGEWSGCNLFYLRGPSAARGLALWRSVERDRKRPWKIVARIGPRLLLAYLFGRLTLARALASLGGTAGLRVAAVPARDGLAAVDVDKPADLELVRALLRDGAA